MSDLLAQLQAAFGRQYTIERELGGGGMARVFVATDSALGRRVVVKLLSPELAADLSAERFAREIKLAASLQQANIVPLLSAGEVDGVSYYTMPYVEGVSLRERLRSGGRPPLTDAVGILRDVAHALVYAHAHGIVHRDIKPENVLLSGGTAVVTDFGIAKALAGARTGGAAGAMSTLTRVGTSIGTPTYMAPEQIAADPGIDHRADVYSFGCLAYELLVGEPPFVSASIPALFAGHLGQVPANIAERRPDTPPPLARVVMRCLEKEPAARPQSVAEILQTIDGLTTSTTRLERLTQRLGRRTVAAISVTAFAVIVATLAMALNGRAPPARGIESLAVLPLENLTGDSSQAYLAAGVTERLITDLARMSGLKRVLARGVVMQYAGSKKPLDQIARELHVDALVTASVLPTGDSLSISVHLVNPVTGAELWANRYQRGRRDLLAIQNDIVSSVLRELKARVSPDDQARLTSRPTLNSDAYEAYLQGRFYWFKLTPADITTAMKYFRTALEKDSTYALAYAGIALTYAARAEYNMEPARDAYAKAGAAALRALQLDDRSSEAHHALATKLFAFDWNFAGAEKEYRRAIELDPNDPFVRAFYGQFLAESGRDSEAAVQLDRALELDPHNAFLLWEHGFRLYLARKYDSAITALRQVLDEQPGRPGAVATLIVALDQKGMRAEAFALRRKSAAAGTSSALLDALVRGYSRGGYRGASRAQAELMVERSGHQFVNPYRIAEQYADAGDGDRAIGWLTRANAERAHRFVHRAPRWDLIRGEPRFQKLLHQFNDPP